MAKALGIITSSANFMKVEGMQDYRPMGAFSFLGRYRVIDFPISNFSNSEIDRIQVYVRENPRSLAEHLSNESYFNINSKKGKLQLLFSSKSTVNDIYNTDITAFAENINIIRRSRETYVILVPSYMVYTQNFDQLLEQHIVSEADITLLYHKVNDAKENYINLTTLNLNRQKGVESLDKNNGTVEDRNIFMNTCIMKKDFFIDLIEKAEKASSILTFSQVINSVCSELDVRGIAHEGFFATVTNLRDYYHANLALLDPKNQKCLFKEEWPIHSVTSDACPTKYLNGSSVKNSLVANGCTIEGSIENCVVGRGVVIEKGAVIKNSIVSAYSHVGKDVYVENQIIDKWAQILHVKKLQAPADQPGYIRRDDML